MSQKHPVIAITGSSGAGTTTVTTTFEQIFRREGVRAAIVEGDSFHRYDRLAMRELLADAMAKGQKKSNKEVRKPKAEKVKTIAASASTKGKLADAEVAPRK